MGVSLQRYLRPIQTVTLEQSARDAAAVMREHHVGCVVVVRDDRPVGIVTDRDLAMRVVAEGRDASVTKIADVVTYDPITVRESDGIDTALTAMQTHGIRRVPIVAGDGRLVGLVTADDVLSRIGVELSALAGAIEGASDAQESR